MAFTNGKESEPGRERGNQFQEGDIVVYNGEEVKAACGDLYFYLEDPDEYGGNKTKATLFQISGWSSWCLGLPRTELEVVGHVDPFPTNHGRDIYRDGNFLPKNKKSVLQPWLGQRPRPES